MRLMQHEQHERKNTKESKSILNKVETSPPPKNQKQSRDVKSSTSIWKT